jgi:hypothetical protein
LLILIIENKIIVNNHDFEIVVVQLKLPVKVVFAIIGVSVYYVKILFRAKARFTYSHHNSALKDGVILPVQLSLLLHH